MIKINIVHTHRADEGFTLPLLKTVAGDARFFPAPLEASQVTVLLGDRTELLEIAGKAILHGQVIAHMAGGERTKGSTDDTVRDALTKLAHLHYPFHAAAKQRILALQEEEWRICVAGNPAVDMIKTMDLLSADELQATFPDTFKVKPKFGDFLIALHPVTNNQEETSECIALIGAMLKDNPRQVWISSPNGDPGSEDILKWLDDNPSYMINRTLMSSLGAHAFRSLMAICGSIIGNSSALITEAPHLGCLPMLIGTRQEGRLPDESDGNACKRILDHIAANIGRPDIRIKA